MANKQREPKTRTIIFSHYEDSVSKNTYRKVRGNWRRIEAWAAGSLPVVSRYAVAMPYIIQELERNQRELNA